MEDQETGSFEKNAGAVERLVKAVPIYQDLLQPATRKLGEGLVTVAGAVNVLLAPLKVFVWSYDKLEEFVTEKVAQKLAGEPGGSLRTPAADVAVPLLESVRLKGHSDLLVDLYAQLLASAMIDRTDVTAHPSFVDTLKQLSQDDAAVLRIIYMKGAVPFVTASAIDEAGIIHHKARLITHLAAEAQLGVPERSVLALDNLMRLGIIRHDVDSSIADQSVYEDLLASIDALRVPDCSIWHDRGAITVGEYGSVFCEACMGSATQSQRAILRVNSNHTSQGVDELYVVCVTPSITTIRQSGLTKLLADIRLRFIGPIETAGLISIKLYLNTNLTSRLVEDPWSEARIYFGDDGTDFVRGRSTGATSIYFADIDPTRLTGQLPGRRFLTIRGVRANANQPLQGPLSFSLDI